MIRSLLLALASLAASAAAPVHLAGSIPGPDGGWDLLGVDPATNRLFVARSDGLMMVDLATRKVTPGFVAGKRLHAALAIPGTTIGATTLGESNELLLFDTRTGAVKARVPTGKDPDAAAWDSASQKLWVMTPGDGSIDVVDAAAGRRLATLKVGGSLELAAADGAGHLFVNVEDRNELVKIDTRRVAVVARAPLPGCDGPTGLALAGRVLISACANGIARFTAAADLKPLGSAAIGARPDGAFADPARHRAYIPSGGDGTLAVFDTRGALPRLMARVSTAKGARTGAVDPRSGRVYLPSASYGAAARTGERPPMVPGSFRLLLVDPSAG
ncbi:YncE family protein [Sphingomonas ginkgonis]|uniref:YncE family protein n=1 Tax=Sphingomonas ginkgonis TaxID=2315330 RepID=A0A3R9WPQ8_9SPHN|nr:YncE family protein [Sphingomonas ginkgonis]RST30437.1 YncE family protein [Sphingomonas ginkgonis]